VRLLHDAGDDVAHPAAVLFEQLLVVHFVETLVEGLSHHLRGDACEVGGRNVLVVLHHAQVAGFAVQDDPGLLVGALAVQVRGEQGLFEHPLDDVERDALVYLDLFERG
jgi:hypothetical protein